MHVDEWFGKHWEREYNFSDKVEYDDKKIWRSIKNNFAGKPKDKAKTELKFTRIDSENGEKVELKGSMLAISNYAGGMIMPFNGFYEIRFSELYQKVNGEWVPFLNERISINTRDLFSDGYSLSRLGEGPYPLCSFAVLRIGWDPNIRHPEVFECDVLSFLRKALTTIG